MPLARRALIAGLGLIGGSIGMALRRAGWQIDFLDPFVPLEDALRTGAADDRVDRFEGGHQTAHDLVILATPVDVALSMLEQIQEGSVVTTVCSVMAPLRARADVSGLNFVAGHPLAGSQEHGLSAARSNLLDRAEWFVDRDHPVVAEMVAACGASLHMVDATRHDEALALTSQLPQLLSTALAALLKRHSGICDQDLTAFAGPGLRTFLRLAGSDVSVWKPVLQANAANLLPHLDALARLSREIMGNEPETAFTDANEFWMRLHKP